MALSKSKKTSKEREAHNMTVKRAYEFENGNVAFDLEIDGWITIYNMTLVALHENKTKKDEITGYFISFPQHKDKEGNYWSYAYFKIIQPEQDMIEEQIEHLLEEGDNK